MDARWKQFAWIVGAVSVLAGPAAVFGPKRYTAYATGVQALGVILALGFAARTLAQDSRDRRVDRVLVLHEHLTEGEMQRTRVRLTHHLRSNAVNGKVHRVTRRLLADDPKLRDYDPPTVDGATPAQDLARVLRFFERADAARLARSIDEPLFHELIGRHAAWFGELLRDDPGDTLVDPLKELAGWADSYPQHKRITTAEWGRTRQVDFEP